MRLRRLGFLLAAAIAALAFASPSRAEILINIDKQAQQMTVTVDGAPRYIWPVSTGKGRYDTPAGEFQPFRMERHHFSREWDDAPMPHSIFFTQIGHAIHGSYDVKHLGQPASHGCVRLSPQHAATLFELVKAQGVKNTHVSLSGNLPTADELVARRGSGSEQPVRDQRIYRDERANGDTSRSYQTGDDDDVTAALPPPPRYARDWRDYHDGPRYYYYRPRPYFFARRYYGRRYYGYAPLPYGRW